MNDKTLVGTRNIYDDVDSYNALRFVVDAMAREIATAVPVRVSAVHPSAGAAGYVDVLPLVKYMAGNGEAIDTVTIFHLPYLRYQGGAAAVIIDPVPGDIGLAVFAQTDSSHVAPGTKTPVTAGSFRHHSQSDGFYLGGFLNTSPKVFLELKQDGSAILTAPGGVTVNGNVTLNGWLHATGNVTSGSVGLQGHTHTGVHGETSTSHGGA